MISAISLRPTFQSRLDPRHLDAGSLTAPTISGRAKLTLALRAAGDLGDLRKRCVIAPSVPAARVMECARPTVLAAAGFDASTQKPFHRQRFPVAGSEITHSRTGFTGDLGYKLWLPPAPCPGHCGITK